MLAAANRLNAGEVIDYSPTGRTILGMSGIHPENLDPEISDRSVAADVLFREEPDEEENEEDEQGEGNEEDDDEGYSE
jgi:hypothetical protein